MKEFFQDQEKWVAAFKEYLNSLQKFINSLPEKIENLRIFVKSLPEKAKNLWIFIKENRSIIILCITLFFIFVIFIEVLNDLTYGVFLKFVMLFFFYFPLF